MHLGYKTSKYKNTTYKSYFIAESRREGKRVKKHVILYLGKLTESRANQIRLICQTAKDSATIITTIENIVIKESKPFLELAVANALWEEWGFSNAFRHVTNSTLPTPLIAKILTLNRCVSPCSHFSIPKWVQKTALPEIISHSLENLNDDKIYYELDKIALNQRYLENHLFEITYKQCKADYDFINYDLSSSYFVGVKCLLSEYGISKDDKSHHKQVLLGILVNNKGYPFSWQVYHGNVAEVETLVAHVDSCRDRFKLKNITLVFDRGLVSNKNLDYITKRKLKYISALDKNQIAPLLGTKLEVFKGVTVNNFKEYLLEQNFSCYDDALYFKDLGLIDNRRYIIGFNPILFQKERQCRLDKISHFENFLLQKNQELREAKRSRKADPIKQSIIAELRRLKIKKYFYDAVLEEIEIERINKKEKITLIKSFSVTIAKKTEVLIDVDKLDGVCLFVSNHTQFLNNTYQLTAPAIIKAYRDKNKIEDAFKHVKSFLSIRPFYVNTEEHVKAVYSLCVLAYFLNKDLSLRRYEIEGIDYLNSKNLYEPFRSCHYVTIQDKLSNKLIRKPVELTWEQKTLLEKLNIEIKLPLK